MESQNLLPVFKPTFGQLGQEHNAINHLAMYNLLRLLSLFLQILAWNPRTFLTEFLYIIPAMISSVTAIEVSINMQALGIINEMNVRPACPPQIPQTLCSLVPPQFLIAMHLNEPYYFWCAGSLLFAVFTLVLPICLPRFCWRP